MGQQDPASPPPAAGPGPGPNDHGPPAWVTPLHLISLHLHLLSSHYGLRQSHTKNFPAGYFISIRVLIRIIISSSDSTLHSFLHYSLLLPGILLKKDLLLLNFHPCRSVSTQKHPFSPFSPVQLFQEITKSTLFPLYDKMSENHLF